MATTELKRTISSAGSQTKWGASAWVKLLGVGTSISQPVYCSSKSDTTGNLRGIFITSDDKIQVAYYDGSYQFQVETNRLLRDPNAFYHLCIAYDSSQSTAADRIKIYVNGVLETSFATSSYPAQNATYNFFGTDITQLVGSLREGSTICNPCVISHLHVTDGYCYPASSYGETDTDTGEWKWKNPSGISYGTNGFFVLKDDAALTDRSGQGNNLSVGSGTITKTQDCPNNNFATLNSLDYWGKNGATISNGNTTVATASAGHRYMISTIGVNKGKYYAEFKLSVAATSGNSVVGITDHIAYDGSDELSQDNYSYAYLGGGNDAVRANGSNVLTSMPTYGANDIICVALDADNNKLYFRKNADAWINSGDPTSGSTGTGAVSITNATGFYYFGVGDWHGSSSATWQCNFGNGYFGTTAVSSAGTNASNLGIFEYDVPAGYTALCTKGLNE